MYDINIVTRSDKSLCAGDSRPFVVLSSTSSAWSMCSLSHSSTLMPALHNASKRASARAFAVFTTEHRSVSVKVQKKTTYSTSTDDSYDNTTTIRNASIIIHELYIQPYKPRGTHNAKSVYDICAVWTIMKWLSTSSNLSLDTVQRISYLVIYQPWSTLL